MRALLLLPIKFALMVGFFYAGAGWLILPPATIAGWF